MAKETKEETPRGDSRQVPATGGVKGAGKRTPRWLDFFLGITPLAPPEARKYNIINGLGFLMAFVGSLLLLAACALTSDSAPLSFAMLGSFLLITGVFVRIQSLIGLVLLNVWPYAPPLLYLASVAGVSEKLGFLYTSLDVFGDPYDDPAVILLPHPPILGQIAFLCTVLAAYFTVVLPLVAFFHRRRLWFEP